MRAVGWLPLPLPLTLTLTLGLTLVLAEVQGDSIAPGIRVLQSRPKRQDSRIIFPDSQSGPGMFVPRPPPLVEPNPEEGPDTALELPEDLDLNTMGRHDLSVINAIENITAFANFFGITLPSQDVVDKSFQIGSRMANDVGDAAEMATMATCKPEIRTVELDLPSQANTLFYPTCVRLEQCGGCCYGPLLTCRPKLTKVVRFKVLKTVVNRSSNIDSARSRSDSRRQRRRRRRRRREVVPSFHVVEAIKHVQCECGCKVQEQDCNPTIHNYLQSECACVCKRRDEKAKCEQQSSIKYWDNDSCACYCRKPVDCGTGEFFSQDSCNCERLVARGGFAVDTVEGHVERSRPFERPSRRRPVRIPLRHESLSNRPTLLNILHSPRREISF
nr:vascular endothelial growth factor b-like protein [Scylla paramamosain]